VEAFEFVVEEVVEGWVQLSFGWCRVCDLSHYGRVGYLWNW
jgi:hypothetical protein